MTLPNANWLRRYWKPLLGLLVFVVCAVLIGILTRKGADGAAAKIGSGAGTPRRNPAASGKKDPAARTTANDEFKQLLSRYSLPVKALTFSLDGQQLATAADDSRDRGKIWIWDLITGHEARRGPTFPGNVYSLALSPDGKTLASSSWGGYSRPGDNSSNTIEIKMWNFGVDAKPDLWLKSEQQFKELVFREVAFNPQGDRLAVGGRPGSLTMYNRETKTPEVSFPTDSLRIDSGSTSFSNLAFSADGKKIAWGGMIVPNSPNPGPNPYPPSVVQVWDALSGKPSITLRPPKSPDASSYVNGIAFLPDSDTLIASCGSKIYFWNLRSGEIEATLDGHRGGIIGALALSRDGKVLASSDSYACIKLWDIPTRREKATLRPPTIYVQGLSKPGMQQNQTRALAFDPDGEILASSTIYWETVDEKHSAQKGFVQLWDVATAKEIALPR